MMARLMVVAITQLFYLQVTNAAQLNAQAASQLKVTDVEKAVRGSVVDSSLNKLAFTTEARALTFQPNRVREQLAEELGVKPWWSLEAFTDPYADVRQSIHRLQMTPFIAHKDHISGYVYDVTDGLLHEVTAD